MAEKKIIDVEVREDGLDELNDGLKETDDSLELVKKSGSGAMGMLDKMTGGAVTKIKSAITAVKGFNISLKATKTAIIATGIGALVIALGAVFTWVTKTQAGTDKLNQIMAALGAVVDVVIDRISSIGSGLADIMSGNFSEGFTKIKDSVKDLGTELAADAKAAWDLADALNKVEDQEISLIKVQAEKRRDISRLKLEAKDLSKSKQDRADILQKAIDLEQSILDEELDIAKKRAAISQAQNDLGESSREELRANEELQAAIIELETSTLDKMTALYAEKQALLAGDVPGSREKVKKTTDFERDPVTGEPIKVIKDNLDIVTESIIGSATARRFAVIGQERKVAEAVEFLEERKRQARLDTLQASANALMAFANLVGQTTGAGKALATAGALINTYLGISEVWGSKSETGLVGAGFVQKLATSAAVAASGFAAVKNINAVQIPNTNINSSFFGGGGGAGSSPGQVAVPDFNIVGNSGVNQLADVISQREQKPIKAYVVSGEIRSGEELDRTIRSSATLG